MCVTESVAMIAALPVGIPSTVKPFTHRAFGDADVERLSVRNYDVEFRQPGLSQAGKCRTTFLGVKSKLEVLGATDLHV